MIQIFLNLIFIFSADFAGKHPDFFFQFLRMGKHFQSRRNHHFRNRFPSALGIGIEIRDSINFIAPEFHSDRLIHLHRINIQNRTADGELSFPLDRFTADISRT